MTARAVDCDDAAIDIVPVDDGRRLEPGADRYGLDHSGERNGDRAIPNISLKY